MPLSGTIQNSNNTTQYNTRFILSPSIYCHIDKQIVTHIYIELLSRGADRPPNCGTDLPLEFG